MARPKNAVLTGEKVVSAAIDLIGANGLEAFSMPKLAATLGVRAPSLYHYFADKDALLAEVARVVATPDPGPADIPPDTDWPDFLVIQALAMRRTIMKHPQCAPLLVRFMPRHNMFYEYEQICALLTAYGVPAEQHSRIVDGLTSLTIGAAILRENAANYTVDGDGPTPDPDTYPTLQRALDAVEGRTPDELFEYQVRTYLDPILRDIRGN